MPIYEYLCEECDDRVDVWIRSAEQIPACPQCGSTALKKQITAPYISKGREVRPPACSGCARQEMCESMAGHGN